jgi:ABC-type polysaccharide/polyol phosphate transport system ATPase subunit
MNPILECNNISKVYKISGGPEDQTNKLINALNNVSFTLNEGDRLGLLGLNGSGKSTLLKIIGGFIKPSSGSILLHKTVSSLSGFDSMLHPDLNAFENCKLQLLILGFKKNEIPELINTILSFAELEAFAYQPVKTFSSGMMLRLSFSIFTVTKPEILLLDEVFSSGDIKFQRKASLLMHQTFKNIPAVIIASHQLSEIQQYCNKCLILNQGEVLFIGKVSDALKFYQQQNKTNNNKPQVSNKLNVISITSTKNKYEFSETIQLNIKYQKLTNQNIDLMINVRNAFGNVLSDCIIYRQDFVATIENPGTYEIQATIHGSVLNAGVYYFDFVFGDGLNNILSVRDELTIEVIPDAWEKDKLWNLNPEYPVRVLFDWKKNHINDGH